jgi:hypothetical protein
MLMQNPTMKRILKSTPWLHQHIAHNNKPGIRAATHVIKPVTPIDVNAPHRSKQGAALSRVQPHCRPQATPTAIPTGAQQRIITQQVMNILTLWEQALFSIIHTPCALMKHAKIPMNFEHYANPMVHPVTGCTITSYKKLMHNPATAEIWQPVFGKDFGGMAQGCNKKGQKGTNAMFVMMHDEIMHAHAAIFFSLMQIQSSTTALKRMTPTTLGSHLGAI